MRLPFVLLGVVFVSLATGAPARADSVTITGGSVLALKGSEDAPMTLTGAGTDISATAVLPGGLQFDLTSGPNREPGYIGPLGPGFTLSQTVSSGTPEMIGGMTILPGSRLTGSFRTITDAFIAPTPTGDSAVFTTPFSLTGRFAVDDSTFELNGGGVATITTGVLRFAGTAVEAYPVTSMDFVFTSSIPSPTPEPASLFLVGIGFAGAIVRRFSLA